jgi:nucleotide-binding universal stress UspA family protein
MFKKILVPLDGSALAEAILPQVTELARVHGAELVILRVALAHAFPGADPTEAQLQAVRESEKYLEGVEQSLKGGGLRVSSVVRYGQAAEEVLDHAAFAGTDLIAMSTHGRTGVSRWVLGSVTEKVLRASSTPLLLVRAPGAGTHTE